MFKILALGACFVLLLAPDTSSALPIPEIVAKAKPAVLKITAYDSDGKPLRFGTGFFISDDGKLVTNLHVIEDAKAITAETVSGASYLCEGVLIQPRDLDLVVLKFKARGVEKLGFGDSSKVTEGGRVIVIGNPEGLPKIGELVSEESSSRCRRLVTEGEDFGQPESRGASCRSTENGDKARR